MPSLGSVFGPDFPLAGFGRIVSTAMPIDQDLIEILRCPLTHSKLRPEGDFLVAEVGGLAYPVRDGIPVMLMEEAKLPAGVGSLEELKKRLANQTGR